MVCDQLRKKEVCWLLAYVKPIKVDCQLSVADNSKTIYIYRLMVSLFNFYMFKSSLKIMYIIFSCR